MADSPTLRARRSRAHHAGDHSLCRPDRCNVVAAEEALLVVRQTAEPDGLHAGGQRLWQQVTAGSSLGPVAMTMLTEACRIVDRLDTLDRQLKGDAWLRFRHDESGTEVTVFVDRVLAEAREQATTLKGLLVELQRLMPSKSAPAKRVGGGVADITARIAARRSPSAG
jgi:hypothetical protein